MNYRGIILVFNLLIFFKTYFRQHFYLIYPKKHTLHLTNAILFDLLNFDIYVSHLKFKIFMCFFFKATTSAFRTCVTFD